MNRAERRAEKAVAKRQKLSKLVAIHEAGHAVARILTAKQFGNPPERSIFRIDVGNPNEEPSNANVLVPLSLEIQATCYGLMFSAEITSFLVRHFDEGVNGYAKANLEERKAAFVKARAEGLAVDNWLEGRLLIDVFGAASEARYLQKPISEVWAGRPAEGDFKEAALSAVMVGLGHEAFQLRLKQALARAAEIVEQDKVWLAVQAVAKMLPNSGSVDGRRVYSAASAALGPFVLPLA